MVDGPYHFIVQYRTQGDESGPEGTRWHLFRIRASLGEGAYLGWTDKAVLAVDSSRVIAQANVDFPQLVVYESGGISELAAKH